MKITKTNDTQKGLMLSGVFGVFLLLGLITAFIYSPVIRTNAEDSVQTKVSTNVAAVASVSVDSENLTLNYNTPTPEGVFDSGTVTATVSTNSPGGYELYFSSVDNTTDMVSTNSSITDVIASDFSGTVTSSTMGKNKWGYSIDNTNYSKIPTSSAHATLRNIDHFPSAAERQNTVRIGAKVDSTLKAGTYSKSVLFSVIAHEPPASATMQTFNKSTLANVGDSAELEDERDGTVYTVKKLADGNVWMTTNLKLQNKVLTSADSDVSSNFTVPASSVSGFNAQDTNNAYVDSTYGGYYTFYTATAGTGGTSLTSGNAPSSICPKGWRLPTGGSSGEFQTLYNNYNSASSMMGVPNFTLSGSVDGGSVYRQGSNGYYWSSTVNNANRAYYLYLVSSDVYPVVYNFRSNGYSVRCVAR